MSRAEGQGHWDAFDFRHHNKKTEDVEVSNFTPENGPPDTRCAPGKLDTACNRPAKLARQSPTPYICCHEELLAVNSSYVRIEAFTPEPSNLCNSEFGMIWLFTFHQAETLELQVRVVSLSFADQGVVPFSVICINAIAIAIIEVVLECTPSKNVLLGVTVVGCTKDVHTNASSSVGCGND